MAGVILRGLGCLVRAEARTGNSLCHSSMSPLAHSELAPFYHRACSVSGCLCKVCGLGPVVVGDITRALSSMEE